MVVLCKSSTTALRPKYKHRNRMSNSNGYFHSSVNETSVLSIEAVN